MNAESRRIGNTWLVDALKHAGYDDDLDRIFAKNQIVTGAAMLVGTIAGGFIAQAAALGVPYLVRAGLQLVSFILALALMKDIGFTPDRVAGFVNRGDARAVGGGFRREHARQAGLHQRAHPLAPADNPL